MTRLQQPVRPAHPRKIGRIEAFPVSLERDLGKATGTAGSPSALRGGAGRYKWSSTVPAIYSERLESTLVRVTTEDGLVGWGEAQAPVAPRVSAVIVEDILAGLLEGESFDGTRGAIEHLWQTMFRAMRVRGQTGGFMLDAISGVDIALWDLAGKMHGLPVAALIAGDGARARVPAYLSGVAGAGIDARVQFAREHFDAGFRHAKVFFDADEDALLATVDALRETGLRVAVDALWRLEWPACRGFVNELSRRDLLWLEAPFAPDEAEPHFELAEAFPDLPLALGESYRTRREMDWFLRERALVRYVQPDLGRSGITETLRIAAMGAAPVVPHVSIALGPQITAAIHVCAALSADAAPLCEYNPQVFASGNLLLRDEPLRMDGAAYVTPQLPGLGISLDGVNCGTNVS